jgi:hypothetical protein
VIRPCPAFYNLVSSSFIFSHTILRRHPLNSRVVIPHHYTVDTLRHQPSFARFACHYGITCRLPVLSCFRHWGGAKTQRPMIGITATSQKSRLKDRLLGGSSTLVSQTFQGVHHNPTVLGILLLAMAHRW